jgi:hypothetical protein
LRGHARPRCFWKHLIDPSRWAIMEGGFGWGDTVLVDVRERGAGGTGELVFWREPETVPA